MGVYIYHLVFFTVGRNTRCSIWAYTISVYIGLVLLVTLTSTFVTDVSQTLVT